MRKERGINILVSDCKAYPSLHTPRLILISLLLLLSACSDTNNQPLQFTGPTMGTTYSVAITPPYPEIATGLEDKIHALLDEINAGMSTWIEDSELSRLNRNDSSDWVSVSNDLYTVLSAAEAISRKTDGAFDITIGAVVNLWGFGPDENGRQLPGKDEIISLMQATGYQKLSLQDTPPAVRKYPGSYLDLSGIAKGYGVDRIADLLEELGIDNYLVEIGGEIRARGRNRRNQSWRVGIERPQDETRTVRDIIALDNAAMATSGGYRNFITHDGIRYSHTIDPATGWPVAHNLTSVTVLHDTAMVADALATALLVMGPDKGYTYAEENKIAALFIVNNNGIFNEKYTSPFLPHLIQ